MNETDQTDQTDEAAEGKKPRNRSPNHPFLDLEDALKRVTELHSQYGKHQVPIANAHQLWGYKEHSGFANQCVAALKAYGFIDVHGQGKERKLQVTDRADRIVRNAPDRAALLKKAAKEPTIHLELLTEYGETGLPPDDILRTYLVWERPGGRFNEDVVDAFIERFRATLGFAALDNFAHDGSGREEDTPKNGNGPKAPQKEVRVGSFVQWTSDGQAQFPIPLKVVGISEDGEWAYVEGSPTGILMSELTIEDAPESAVKTPKAPPVNPFFKPPSDDEPEEGVALERTTLDEGPVRLEWPDELSQASVEEFQYWINGLLRRARRKAGLPIDEDA
jgi:hypothetical protein